MAEYLPIYKPGQALTLKASAAITGGQLVVITGSGSVGPAGAAAANWVGVAAFDAATNDNVTIHSSGVQSLTASGAVTAGDSLVSAAAGQVATGAAATPSAFVGVALTTAVNGAKVRVKFAR
jgi:hypothetical protein